MIDSYFRDTYQKILVEPIIQKIADLKITPNMVTTFACLVGVGFLPAMAMQQKSLVIFLLIFSAYLDTLDGSLARKTNTTSNKGAILDIVCDRIVELAAVLGLYFYAPDERALVCLVLLGSFYLCITTFLVVGIFEENASNKGFHYSPGIIERTETIIFLVLAVLFDQYFMYLTYIFAALVYLTAFIRLR